MKQENLFGSESEINDSGPVECLGMAFESDEARRTHFTDLLRVKLKDPEFRAIEGFPVGTDEAILELSDPPYYTACPNPWLNDFVEFWTSQKESSGESYHREPFAADVSEGKNEPIYVAHSYHTKVPYKAIMRYILHYTEPGDIVLDGFCGTGMTGVAAQMCSKREVIESLGYKVLDNGDILELKSDGEWCKFSKIGARRAVLNDLSPAASLIASNYNKPIDAEKFLAEAFAIANRVTEKYGWLYEVSTEGSVNGVMNYTVYSDVKSCSECNEEFVFWDVAYDKMENKIRDVFSCRKCNATLNKKNAPGVYESYIDHASNEIKKRQKKVPVLVNYKVGKKIFQRDITEEDIKKIDEINNLVPDYWYPSNRMMDGKESRRNDDVGLTHVNDYYTNRNLIILSCLYKYCKGPHKLLFQSIVATLCSKLVRYNLGKRGNGPLSGTLYVSSLNAESNVINAFLGKAKDFVKAFLLNNNNIVQAQSFTGTKVKSNSLDYIFIDPPFGANLNYSELNFIWESWLKVTTNVVPEAIQNPTQNKGLLEYKSLMYRCFKEAYRVLKPGRWMTVEFSNTKASVWNSIQTSLLESGFMIANVSTLDKKQGTFKAVNTATAVKQDLVISAYKPEFDIDTSSSKIVEQSDLWKLVELHLSNLNVVKYSGGELSVVLEREPRIIYDRVLSNLIRNSILIPMSSSEFQRELAERYSERDGMIFLSNQVYEYDKARANSVRVQQLNIFVEDEASAIDWLRTELKSKPRTYAELHPIFLKEMNSWKKNELYLELQVILEQNFLKFDGEGEVPAQIHSYLSSNFKDMRGLEKDDELLVGKAINRWYVPDASKLNDLEKIRAKSLIKEFNSYLNVKGKIKQPRSEALRAGFKYCWEKSDIDTIITMAGKIPISVIEEDELLLMFYDNALTISSPGDEW
ncbi:DNA methyltransferase [Photobacterium leiognathi]|uniref:DNA methyltransferase n=1 Tax=Photobacterium leiognathi TaxID=553611 RepID=UPI002981DAC7|nr:DNA methyltransferase [Photobacterium leiognathi]